MGTVTEVSFHVMAPDDTCTGNCLRTDANEKLFQLIKIETGI